MKRKAQSIAEYAILIGVVASAIMAMNVYIKRGVQAGIKMSIDQMGSDTAQRDGAGEIRFTKKGIVNTLASEQTSSRNAANTITSDVSGQTYGIQEAVTVSAFAHTRVLSEDKNE